MIPVYLAKHLRQHTVRGCSLDRRICPVHNLAQHNPVLRPQLTQHTRSPHHNPAHNLVLRPLHTLHTHVRKTCRARNLALCPHSLVLRTQHTHSPHNPVLRPQLTRSPHNPVLRPQLTHVRKTCRARNLALCPLSNLVLRPQLSQLHALKKGLVTMRPGVNLLR